MAVAMLYCEWMSKQWNLRRINLPRQNHNNETVEENKPDFASELSKEIAKAEGGLRGIDPGPWRVVAKYLVKLEQRVASFENRQNVTGGSHNQEHKDK